MFFPLSLPWLSVLSAATFAVTCSLGAAAGAPLEVAVRLASDGQCVRPPPSLPAAAPQHGPAALPRAESLRAFLRRANLSGCRHLTGTKWLVVGASEQGSQTGAGRRMAQVVALLHHLAVDLTYTPAKAFRGPPRPPAQFQALQFFPRWRPTPPAFLRPGPATTQVLLTDDVHCVRQVQQDGRPTALAREVCAVEAAAYRASDVVVTVTAEDRRAIATLYPLSQPRLRLLPMAPQVRCDGPSFEARHGLLFIGAANTRNREGLRWFGRHVYPLLAAALPNVTLTLLGGAPLPSTLRSQPRVVALGKVSSAMLSNHVRTARVLLAPMLHGTGISTKLHTAIEHCLPSVTTPHGARGFCEGVATPMVAVGAPGQFAEAVARLHGEAALWTALRRQQGRWLEEHRRAYLRLVDGFCSACRPKKASEPSTQTFL
eukprot:EG_transcript_13697